MSIVDDAKEIKDWINDDDPCDTGDLEPYIVLQMCNYILRKKNTKTASGDHILDATKKVWQITEERVGLLEYCLDSLLDAPDIEESPGPCHSIEMLRAMLQEAAHPYPKCHTMLFLAGQEEDELSCHSCGKSIDEVIGDRCKGDYFIGSIFLDPGQAASRFDPPIDASYYFACCDCSRSWRITEERKAALMRILEYMDYMYPRSSPYYHCKDDTDLLRAMLQEAGQE